MAKCVFIVQGEGRGHMSQSLALKEYLVGAGHQVEAVFVGTSNAASLPELLSSAGTTGNFAFSYFRTIKKGFKKQAQ